MQGFGIVGLDDQSAAVETLGADTISGAMLGKGLGDAHGPSPARKARSTSSSTLAQSPGAG